VAWAHRATAGLDESGIMIGLLDGRDSKQSERYWSFAIQVGRCLLEGKPLLLMVPIWTEIPERLRAAASAVEYYRIEEPDSVQAACKRAFERIGLVVKH
jgi:hypothetical protein